MNWLDFSIIAICLFSVVISLVRGLVKEALSLISWALAIYIAIRFGKPLAAMSKELIHNDGLRTLAAYFILFAITLILGALLNYLISQLVQKTGLSGTDRVLGMVFGFVRGGLVVGLCIVLAGLTQIPTKAWWQESVLIPEFKPVAVWIEGFMPKTRHFKIT